MSKIFKISGNFRQYGEWSTPDPSFVGEIVVDDANTFCGYCDELYDSKMSALNKTRFLAGAIAPNGRNGKNGIAFYKMSNDGEQAPLMYVVPNLEDPSNGSWAALTPFGFFQPVGQARVEIEEKAASAFGEDEKRIKAKFDELDKNINGNDQLLEQMQCCIDIIVHAE